MGQRILVLKAAKAAEEKKSLEEVTNWLEKEREKIQVWASLDTLKYALAGGRIPREEFEKIATFLGGMVSRVFKVMVTLKEGRPSLAGIQFLFKGAISSLVKKVERAQKLGLEYLTLMHIANPAGIRLLLNELAKFYPREEIILAEISTVLAAHSGRGTIGLAFSTKERG